MLAWLVEGFRGAPRPRRALAFLFAMSVCWVSGSAGAQVLPPKRAAPAAPLVACTIAPLSLTPLLAAPAAAPSELSSDEADEEDDDEEEEEVAVEDLVGGFRRPGEGTCIAVTAALTTSVQYNRRKVPPALRTGTADLTSFLSSGTVGFQSSTITSDGTRIDVRLALLFQSPDASGSVGDLKEAAVDIGSWSFGFAPSIFNFWTGEDFLFGLRVPARSGVQMVKKWQLTESWSVALALEDTQATPTSTSSPTNPTAPGPHVPDVVGRIRYEGDRLEAHVAAAVTEIRSVLPGQPVRWGKAAIVGTRWSLQLAGLKHALTAQGAWAADAPIYLGLQNDSRTLRSLLIVGDTTRGFSGSVAWTMALSDRLSFNLYASRLRLDFPKLAQTGGRAELVGGAANLVWMPAKGLRIGAEVGLAQAKLDLPGRLVANDPSGRQLTGILWIDRSF